jgi:hypothetical protein
MKKYLVGRSVKSDFYVSDNEKIENGEGGNITDIIGIFNKEEKAVEVCRSYRHFIAELEEDVDLSDEISVDIFTRCYYPNPDLNPNDE